MRGDYLFQELDFFNVREGQKLAVQKEVDGYDSNRLLNTSTEELCRYLETKYQVQFPTLKEQEAIVDEAETKIDVSRDPMRFIEDPSRPFYIPGTQVELTVPFDGDPDAFKIKPTTFTYNPPVGRIQGNNLIITVRGPDLTSEKVKAMLDQALAQIREWLGYLKGNLSELNSIVSSTAKTAVEARKARLLSDKKLVASLGYRVRLRDGKSGTYAAPEVKRKVEIRAPTPSATAYAPEPTLVDSDFDQILQTIGGMASVMELSPSAFTKMDEEALRFHFLVQLNGIFQGQATGETFNYSGKTDILVKSNGKNIFIAECKYWSGPKKLTETIDQILGYSSWRDTKVAVIVFNRRKNFSEVLKAIQETTATHPNCKRLLRNDSETTFRYLFAHRDDPNREMYLTCLAFDVPSEEAST